VFRLIRQHTTTPLAVGEVFNSIHDCRQLIEEQLVDYIRTSVAHAGGITHLRRIAAVAEINGVRTGSHGATDLSPVCLAAALHFDLHVHNFGIQEYMPHAAETDRVFPHAYRFHAGVMPPGDAPGLGVELDEALAATFPYEPAWLPVARRAEGTMDDWRDAHAVETPAISALSPGPTAKTAPLPDSEVAPGASPRPRRRDAAGPVRRPARTSFRRCRDRARSVAPLPAAGRSGARAVLARDRGPCHTAPVTDRRRHCGGAVAWTEGTAGPRNPARRSCRGRQRVICRHFVITRGRG